MSLVVSDASPLNALVLIGRVHLLRGLFGTVIVPPEVEAELDHPQTPESVKQFMGSRPAWVHIRGPGVLLPLPGLDAGERAAISLASELQATLLIDEQDGRRAATDLGLEILGVVGILERAATRGLLRDLAAAHEELRATNFRIDPRILAVSLARHQDRRRGM